VETLQALRSKPSHAAILLDIDGTLAPIVRHADDAHVPEATRTLLIEVAKSYALVACVSGRRAHAARQIVAIGSIAYIGNHGGELLRPGSTHVELDPELAAWSERVRELAERLHTPERQRLRVRMEDKQAIVAFHWRGAPDEDAAAAAVREIAAGAAQEGFVVHWGRKVLEIRPPIALDKGLGVRALLNGAIGGWERAGHEIDGEGVNGRRPGLPGTLAHETAEIGCGPIEAALYVGDDTTDLDAFAALRELRQSGELQAALCVAVSSEEAPPELVRQADLTIEGPDGVRRLLQALL
jgi:trehalose 6-phosphate phosphatase